MKTVQGITICALLVMCQLLLCGCGSKTDEKKPISEVKAEAEKMDTGKLRTMAEAYKNAIVAKKGDIEKVTAKLKEIPATELLGQEAKDLKADIENLNQSVSALKERFEVYYQKLKEKGGDLSGLQI
jgi:predicted  nucleic acid-binding Zn-ribbon protein